VHPHHEAGSQYGLAIWLLSMTLNDPLPNLKIYPRQQLATQGRAGQGRAGQGRAGQGRAGQGRAGQGSCSSSTCIFHRSRLGCAGRLLCFS
jgi:hypothetical protein